jgi:dienelactone hydrolase
MTRAVGILCLILTTSNAMATIVTKDVTYKAGDTSLKGYVAYDDQKQGKLPAVVVVPEWWGNNDYPKRRARMLAELGYVAFAADMYGDGKTTEDAKQAGEWAGAARKDMDALVARFNAAVDQLKGMPNVDPNKIGAIGYCFGGGVALEMAKRGADLAGVVSFHGSVPTDHPENAKKIKGQVLVLTGADDPMVPKTEVDKFDKQLTDAGVKHRVVAYPSAVHAFTNSDVDRYHLNGAKYNADADAKSWDAMKQFFAEVFGK